jgi:hypothetical protein
VDNARERAALIHFSGSFIGLLGFTVAELLKLRGGEIPDELRRAIHERLPAVSEAALAVPETVSAVRIFDLFVAMVPPPDRPRSDE